jgi:hypothetical protein
MQGKKNDDDDSTASVDLKYIFYHIYLPSFLLNFTAATGN